MLYRTACASSSHNYGQDLNTLPRRETSWHRWPSMYASARNPSYFGSKTQSGSLNGSPTVASGNWREPHPVSLIDPVRGAAGTRRIPAALP